MATAKGKLRHNLAFYFVASNACNESHPHLRMTAFFSGYSDTPLFKKLGIKEETHLVVMNGPDEYLQWLAPLPTGVVFDDDISTKTDVIHIFVSQSNVLKEKLALLRNRIRKNAVVWVSWPKKSCKVPTDVTEDVIRAIALPIGFVDVKVCAVSEVWSGLKLYIRKEFR